MSDVRNVVLWRESYTCAADDVNGPHELTTSVDIDTATIETIVNCIRDSGYISSGWGKRWVLRAYNQYGTELATLTRPWRKPTYSVDRSSLLKNVVWPNATPALYLCNDG